MLDFCPQKSDLVELTLSDITMILLNRQCPKFASLCLACLINMSHQSNGSNRYKNEIIQRISIRQIYELVETYTNSTIGSNDNITYQVMCLLRNLVDENNLLVEAKGDDIIKICHYWLCGNFNWFKKHTSEPKLYLTAITHILKNISSLPDGVTKLCSNEDLIRAIVELLSDDDVNVKTQSSFIISNLLHEQATGKGFYYCFRNSFTLLTLIRESWKKSRTRDRDRARFPGKNPDRSVASFFICFCALDIFSGNRARSRSQKWHTFSSVRQISPHNGI